MFNDCWQVRFLNFATLLSVKLDKYLIKFFVADRLAPFDCLLEHVSDLFATKLTATLSVILLPDLAQVWRETFLVLNHDGVVWDVLHVLHSLTSGPTFLAAILLPLNRTGLAILTSLLIDGIGESHR